MSWRVIIRPNAEADARDARLLEEHPDRRPIYYRGFRRLLTRRFPYKLFYRLEGDRVIIFRILHAKRDHQRQLGG